MPGICSTRLLPSRPLCLETRMVDDLPRIALSRLLSIVYVRGYVFANNP